MRTDARSGLIPSPRHVASVAGRNARVFSKLWKGSLAPQFIDPLFYLMAMGYGLGTYIASINGVPYKDFIAPGLVASAAMWQVGQARPGQTLRFQLVSVDAAIALRRALEGAASAASLEPMT